MPRWSAASRAPIKSIWSTHCHDDLGLAVANTLAALAGGARQVECTINGIGERAGNASLEEVVMATRVRSDRLPFDTGIDTREIFAASQLLTALTGEAVQANKAIVGRNAFAHEAGIHQDGMLKDRRTYEIMRPEEVGVPEATLVLGKHSGRHAVQRRCEQIGVTLTRHELDQVYRAVIALADRAKIVNDADLREIIGRMRDASAPVPGTTAHAGGDGFHADPGGERLRSRGLARTSLKKRDPTASRPSGSSVSLGQRLLAQCGGTEQPAHAHRLDRRARDQHQRAFLLQSFVEHVHRAEVKRGRVVVIRLRRDLERLCDLHFRLAEDDPRLLLASGLRLA